MRIQVDMFAVELGAAMLLQFETGTAVVRVLADAGKAEHDVNGKLQGAIQSFGNDSFRIDLLVGTHYDADHLDGLVAVIENRSISIGEAWLPPVANDTEPHAISDTPDDKDLLPLQLVSEGGENVLHRYVHHKADLCDRLEVAERTADVLRGIERESVSAERFRTRELNRLRYDDRAGDELATAFFHAHVKDAEQTIGAEVLSHGDEQVVDPWEVIEIAESLPPDLFWSVEDVEELAGSWLRGRADRAAVEATTLAMIRRSAAKDAINAKSLAAVVKALKDRKIEIRCSTIVAGQPRRFYWTPSTSRFSPIRTPDAKGPELLLLGPSDSLVRMHWDRLPIGTYASMAFRSRLPIKPITPSNQLSYVMALEHSGQRVLITGDAGCVDFKPGRNKAYYPKLIQALAPLQVVQVAHHAGHNAHFYRCLLASTFPAQDELSYLLLSHSTDDKHRPSDVFGKFIELLRRNSDGVQLLFTSRPLEEKVRDVKALIGQVAGGPSKSAGDVRVQFGPDGWGVTRHAVAVP